MKLLKFSADWCQPCKLQKKEFESNPLNVELVEIDIDEDTEGLTHQYKILSIPTSILIDDDNKVINRWTGFIRTEVINDFIKKLK